MMFLTVMTAEPWYKPKSNNCMFHATKPTLCYIIADAQIL